MAKSKVFNNKTLPFSIFSSSINTGYQAELSSSFYPSCSIEGNHRDDYSPRYLEGTIQGTFASVHVGGRSSAHASGTSRQNRAERYDLVIQTGSMSLYSPIVGLPADRCFREPMAKRPFNFKNILGENFDKNYQVVHTTGRKIQNRDFYASGGYAAPTASELPFSIHSRNYNIGERTKTGDSVIVARFGMGEKKQSRDFSSLEESAYNANPWSGMGSRSASNRRLALSHVQSTESGSQHSKNLNVGWTNKNRFILATDDAATFSAYILSRYQATGKFAETEELEFILDKTRYAQVFAAGVDSYSSVDQEALNSIETQWNLDHHPLKLNSTADALVINGNSYTSYQTVLERIEMEGDVSVTNALPHKFVRPSRFADILYIGQFTPQYDNGFVSHHIPRNDIQYAWQRRTLQPQCYYGHFDNINQGTYASSSHLEQQRWDVMTDNMTVYNGPDSQPAVSFAGYGIYLQDPCDISTNTIGHSSGSALSAYRYIPYSQMVSDMNTEKYRFLERSWMSDSNKFYAVYSLGCPEYVAVLNQMRNGIYGWPSWRQIRNDNVLLRHQKKTSTFWNRDKMFREPRVSFNSPISQTIQGNGFVSSYTNLRERFANVVLNSQTEAKPNETFFDIADRGEKLSFTEKIWPNKVNIGLSIIRRRENFEKWWKDEISDRFDVTKLFDVSNNGNYSESEIISKWPLDQRPVSTDIFSGSDRPWVGVGIGMSHLNAGELQQFNSIFYLPLSSKANADAKYSWAKSPIYARATHSGSVASGSTPGFYGENAVVYFDTKWETAEQSGRQPYYKDYSEYLADIKPLTQKKSLIPEFRISEHMDFYIDNGGDFLIENEGAFTVNQSAVSSSLSSSFESDYLLSGDNIAIKNLIASKSPNKIKLSCEGLLKFFPYQGFYPVERSVECVNLFSASYTWSSGSDTANANAFDRPVYSTLFSPGLLYNTIKSGVAVDFPKYVPEDVSYLKITGSNGNSIADASTGSIDSGMPRIHLGVEPNALVSRFPFETLLEPENYLRGVCYDIEPNPMSRMTGTYNYNLRAENKDGDKKPLYQLGMHNFLAETINFFLKNGSLTAFASKPKENVVIDSSKTEYIMVLKMFSKPWEKTATYWGGGAYVEPTFFMYSSGSAFGPPSSHTITAPENKYGVYSPFTPPYFDHPEGSEIVLSFTPWKTDSNVYTLQEIVSNLKIKGNDVIAGLSGYINIGRRGSISPDSPTLTSDAYGSMKRLELLNKTQNARVESANSWMQITASVNVNIVENIKNVEYDPYSGKATNIGDTTDKSTWIIQTKFETPILNFANCSSSLDHMTLESHYRGHVGAGNIGMWHQYAGKPSKNEGVFLQIKDLESDKETGFVSSPSTGSLAELVGFDKKEIKLGETENSKLVREAVVLVPYIESPKTKDKIFFYFDEKKVENAIAGRNSTPNMMATARAMQKYVFPPRYDWVNNRYKNKEQGADNVRPFKMFVFEYEREFSSQDLIDIWQNVMPESFQHFELQKREITLTDLEDADIFASLEDVRWMVFKVKQKAEKNYYAKTASSSDDQRFSFELKVGNKGRKNYIPEYSFNWPYDFMSLCEFAEVDMEAIYGEDE